MLLTLTMLPLVFSRYGVASWVKITELIGYKNQLMFFTFLDWRRMCTYSFPWKAGLDPFVHRQHCWSKRKSCSMTHAYQNIDFPEFFDSFLDKFMKSFFLFHRALDNSNFALWDPFWFNNLFRFLLIRYFLREFSLSGSPSSAHELSQKHLPRQKELRLPDQCRCSSLNIRRSKSEYLSQWPLFHQAFPFYEKFS